MAILAITSPAILRTSHDFCLQIFLRIIFDVYFSLASYGVRPSDASMLPHVILKISAMLAYLKMALEISGVIYTYKLLKASLQIGDILYSVKAGWRKNAITLFRRRFTFA